MRRQSILGWSCFDVLWFDESALRFRVKQTPVSSSAVGYFGIDWRGLRNVAKYSGYNWDEFCVLESGMIASAIAYYRIENHVSALVAEWQVKESESKSLAKRYGKKG